MKNLGEVRGSGEGRGLRGRFLLNIFMFMQCLGGLNVGASRISAVRCPPRK